MVLEIGDKSRRKIKRNIAENTGTKKRGDLVTI